jgi:hypothetical protein
LEFFREIRLVSWQLTDGCSCENKKLQIGAGIASFPEILQDEGTKNEITIGVGG